MEMCACADCRAVALIHGALRTWRLRRRARLEATAVAAETAAAVATGTAAAKAAAKKTAKAARAAAASYQPPDHAKAPMVRTNVGVFRLRIARAHGTRVYGFLVFFALLFESVCSFAVVRHVWIRQAFFQLSRSQCHPASFVYVDPVSPVSYMSI